MAANKASFNYSRLKQPQGFRLLRIASDEEDHGHLRCVIEHYVLEEDNYPDYAAISYCWGDPRNTEDIIVNGLRAVVTVNLAAALRQLRRDRQPDEGYLWADALCINQEDSLEKAKQIELMPRIYSGATKVITWLSQEDRDAEHLAYLSAVTLKNPKRGRDQAAFFRAVTSLSGKNYWTRIWIVQELSLARNIEVVCKGQRVSWQKFIQLACSHMGLPLSPNMAGAASDILSDSRVIELDAMRQDIQNQVPMPTLRALYRTRACQSTIKNDRIFAILGLTSDGKAKLGRLRYSDEYKITLLNLTLSEIEETGRLDLITFPDRRDAASYNVRTWSPNWINRALWHRLRVWQLHQVLHTADESFHATTTSIHPRFDPKRYELKVVGFSIGKINPFDSPTRLKYKNPSSLADAAEALITEFPETDSDETFHWTFSTHKPSDSKKSHKVTSSIASLTLDNNIPSTKSNREFSTVRITSSNLYRSRVQQLVEYLEPLKLRRRVSSNEWLIFQDSAGEDENPVDGELGTRSWIKRDPEKFRSTDLQFLSELRSLLHLGSAYANQAGGELTISNMRFVGTSQGLIGLAHSSAKPDDAVYLIEGCSTPIVLRERKNAPGSYEVVGEALIIGIMKGEYFNKKKKGGSLLGPSFKRSDKETLSLV